MYNLQKMGKTSYENMTDLGSYLTEKLKELEDGSLNINALEKLVEDARELYERLLIVKYKAYEKYGEPQNTDISTQMKESPSTDQIEEETQITNEIKEESFDFTGITEKEVEQPSFDFSTAENIETKEEEEVQIDIVEEETKSEAIEVETSNETADLFKEIHVEKHEEEDENSLNVQLKTEEELSLRKKIQNSPIADLKSEISIAKKFEYITFMFDGDNANYEAAIKSLNECNDGEEAKNRLNDYSTKYNWDLENKSIIKFVELVERRYL